jgi:hypothetical protein
MAAEKRKTMEALMKKCIIADEWVSNLINVLTLQALAEIKPQQIVNIL